MVGGTVPLVRNPSFELIAFLAPVVEPRAAGGPRLRLTVHTDTGPRDLVGSPENFAAAHAAFASALALLGVAASAPAHRSAPVCSPKTGRPHGNRLRPEKLARYQAAWRRWRTEGLSQAEAAVREGLSVGALQQWIYNHRAELDAIRLPLLKPKGRIA